MANAARAIIFKDNKILVMRRNKQGANYYTLVGGVINDTESLERGVAREVKEETGLEVTSSRLVFTELHPEPYNNQYIFLCEVTQYEAVTLQVDSEEALLNKDGLNIHEPLWVSTELFGRLPFLTLPLQQAIVKGLKKKFPKEPVAL